MEASKQRPLLWPEDPTEAGDGDPCLVRGGVSTGVMLAASLDDELALICSDVWTFASLIFVELQSTFARATVRSLTIVVCDLQ